MDPHWQDQLWQLERRVAADPANVPLRCELLRWQSRAARLDPEGPVERARQANLEVLYALSPRDPAVLEVLAMRVDPRYLPPPPADPEAVAALEQAELAAADDRHDDACCSLEAALLAAPDAPLVHLRAGELRLAEARWSEALAHLRFAVERAPESARVWAACGAALRGLRREREAFDHFLEALQQNPLCALAERGLIELGPELGYTWQRAPLPPVVWPIITVPGGRSYLMARRRCPWPARAAWTSWAQAVLARCTSLPEGAAPLAGLPRELDFLVATHRILLTGWRRRRVWRLPGRRRAPERDLDWLAAVDGDGQLEAYLLYSYLHPDLAATWQAWRKREPAAMERFLRRHMAVCESRR